MPKVADALLMFAPERWGQVQRFRTLHATTYALRRHQQRVLAGVENHFHKANTLFQLAHDLMPALKLDEAELEQNGFTPGRHAKKFAAIVETVITELYSVIDCTAKTLFFVYGPSSRGMQESTRRIFTRVDAISGAFPDHLKDIIRSCHWYEDLRQLRDELTHSDVGSCSTDWATGLVRYWHSSATEGQRLQPIDHIIGWLTQLIGFVDAFTDSVFRVLNETITAGTVTQMCGMVQGRMLMRLLDVALPIDFHNGTCLSAQWFDLPENPRCPFADGCGAYRQKATPEQLRTVYGE